MERCVFIVGEALSHVPPDVRDRHPQVPWREIIGMRNILAHGYFKIDPMVLWTTVQRDLAELVAELERVRA